MQYPSFWTMIVCIPVSLGMFGAEAIAAFNRPLLAIVGEDKLIDKAGEAGWVVLSLVVLMIGVVAAFAWLGRKHIDAADKRESDYRSENSGLQAFIRTDLHAALTRNIAAMEDNSNATREMVAAMKEKPCNWEDERMRRYIQTHFPEPPERS